MSPPDELGLFGPRGYPTNRPEWTAVPSDQLNSAPYNRIWAVGTAHQQGKAQIGTSWRLSASQFLTAAHVVEVERDYFLRHPSSEAWLACTVMKIADGYFRPNGKGQVCSPFDWAVVEINVPQAFSEPEFALTVQANKAMAVGYVGNKLVRHVGPAESVGPFIAHTCHTVQGHSGCPIFSSAGIVGLHVGLLSGSRPYIPSGLPVPNQMNSAIALQNIQL